MSAHFFQHEERVVHSKSASVTPTNNVSSQSVSVEWRTVRQLICAEDRSIGFGLSASTPSKSQESLSLLLVARALYRTTPNRGSLSVCLPE